MGSPESEKGRDDDETQHRVRISRGFWMLEHEVTQEMYESLMGNNPSEFSPTGDGKNEISGSTAQYPVERVDWEEAQAFCKKLSEESGYRCTLPSEAQWEYACRAGTTMPFHFGAVLNGDKANCDGNYPYGTETKGTYLNKTTPVKSYKPNGWGLYDMHGNVWEWCSDWYDGDYYKNSPSMDPEGPDSGSDRVSRGGGWDCNAQDCRSGGRAPRG